jgi:putative hydrolase of the HAD superfamily
MKGVEAVFFDAGGTLIHVDGERVCRAAAIPYDSAVFERATAAATAAVRARVLCEPQSTDAERLPLFLDAMLVRLGLSDPADRRSKIPAIVAEHNRSNLWSRAGEEATQTLDALSQRGYRLGVISNADGRVKRLLEETQLAQYLDVVIDSAEVGFEKPDPRIFLAACDRLALAPPSCAYVGDIYEIDVTGARAAGLHVILFGSCPAPEPVKRVMDLAELLSLFPCAPTRAPEAERL